MMNKQNITENENHWYYNSFHIHKVFLIEVPPLVVDSYIHILFSINYLIV